MRITPTSKSPQQVRSACVVVPVFEKQHKVLDKILDKSACDIVQKVVGQSAFSGKPSESLVVHTPNSKHQSVILIGAGKKNKWEHTKLASVARNAAAAIVKADPKDSLVVVSTIANAELTEAECLQHFAYALHHKSYRYETTKSKKAPKAKLSSAVLSSKVSTAKATKILQQAEAVGYANDLCRDLGNLPGNICTPSYIVKEAQKVARSSTKISIKVLKESDMKRLNMGAFLSVSRGSKEPGFMVCLEYKGAAKTQAPVALVGKGITFDTGGISIKPSGTMDEMKFDMSGAASVLATMAFCAKMQLKLNVVGVLACAENMPGGNASKPGDIVTTMSGQTVEVLNTDAEGRLVLCDALTYVGRYKPDCVIDIATLTGACVVALGQEASGLMSNHQSLANELLKASETSGDRTWQLPMWDEYQPQLKSNFADIANIGGRWAGTITAACFLSRFTEDYRWAHLDVAGVAWNTGANKGSTGRPVPLLTQFLLQRAGE